MPSSSSEPLRHNRDYRQRGIARDESWMTNARERCATRYFPGETRYLEEVDPESIADLVVATS